MGGKSAVVMVLTNSGWVGGWEECCGYGVDQQWVGGWEECCGYGVDQQWVGGWVGGKSAVVMVLTNSGWVGGWVGRVLWLWC